MKQWITKLVKTKSYLILIALFQGLLGTAYAEEKPIKANAKIIKGYVNDSETSDSMPGVSVTVKGTPAGTVTDKNGNYEITVPSSNSELVFSFIGYESQTILVGEKSVINVSLKEASNQLNEVVVVGFGEVNKRDLTGAVGKVNAEKINELPVAGFDKALQGKVAGVRVTTANAAPGGGFDMQIRGVSSLTASSQPLVVIDGLPIVDIGYQAENNPLNLVNPNDIVSMEVLKDASSAAIYGSRGSAGVILITTKKGKAGKPVFNFNASNGVSQAINLPEVGSREQYVQWNKDIRNFAYWKQSPGNYSNVNNTVWKWSIDNEEDYQTRSKNMIGNSDFTNNDQGLYYLAFDPARMTPATNTQIKQIIDNTAYWYNTDTDWVQEIQRSGRYPGGITQYNLSVGGGTENTRYQVSGSYFKEKGTIQNTDFGRYTFNINLETDVAKWLKIGTKISPSWQDLNNIGGGSVENRWFSSPLYQSAMLLPPILAPYNADGTPVDYSSSSPWSITERHWGGTFYGNPMYVFQQSDKRTTFRALGNLFAEATLFKDIKLKSAMLTDYGHGQQRTFRPSTMGDRFNPPGDQNLTAIVNATNQQDRRFKYYWENSLTYTKSFKNVHNLNALALYTQEKTYFDRVFVRKTNFVTNDIERPSGGITVTNPLTDATDAANTDAFIGLLGRVQYNYKGKYYLTAAVRRDGSSRFGINTLWGNFPSAAVAWRISDEPFMKPLDFIYDLKLRASYGETGNSGIPMGRQQAIYSNASYVSGERIAQGVSLSNLYDPNLSWEKTKEVNLGADLALFKGRLGVTAEYYNRKTTDMLLFLDLPQYAGYGSVLTNFGSMMNRGIELGINATPIANKNLTLTTDFNISANRGKITRLFAEEQAFITGAQVSGWTDMTRGYVGGPLSVFWGTIADGIYNDWDEIENNPIAYNYSNGNLDLIRRSSNAPGEIRYKDVNGDGIINLDDRTAVGNPWPDYVWGFNSTLKAKNFDLFIQIDGSIGAEIFNVVRYEWFRQSQTVFNMPADWLSDYWTPTNTDAKYPIISIRGGINGGLYNNMWQGTFIKEDGDFTAIRNIRLGYTLPNGIASRLKLTKVRVYTNIQNALYFTKYSGFNPEGNNRGLDVSNQGQRSNNYGVDGGNYPLQRTITLGLDLTF
jgi:TonB-dependent starch-binding outer membrane protein SusC